MANRSPNTKGHGRPAHIPKPGERTPPPNKPKAKAKTRKRKSLADKDTNTTKVQVYKSKVKKDAFLRAFAQCGAITTSAQRAGISVTSYYAWTNPKYYDGRFYDESFIERLDEALLVYQDKVRVEIDRRAIEGWEEPVFGSVGFKEDRRTEQVGSVRKYSDRLLELRAKASLPEMRQLTPQQQVVVDSRSVTLNGSKQEAESFDASKLTKEQRELMRQFLLSSQPSQQQQLTKEDVVEGEVVDRDTQ